MSEYLELPWSVEDTINNLKELKDRLQERCIIRNLHGRGEKDAEEIAFDFDRAIKALEEIQQYRAIGTVEECRAAMEKQIVEKELESHDEKYILKYCISLMQELVGKFEEWYEYVHGEDAIRELDEEERFYYRMSYFSIVQELFLFRTSHSGGTSTRAKCKQLGVDWSDGIEFSFGGDEE